VKIQFVDVIFGAAWGDEGKGKICYRRAKSYDYVCRFNGGPNAGHTIYHEGQKIVTHSVPTGIIHNKKCIIGPGCVLNIDSFHEEIKYLSGLGLDISLVKVHPHAHIITKDHVEKDKIFKSIFGTTGQGVGPCFADKALRIGQRAISNIDEQYLWDGEISGSVLCEGAQSAWLDINHGQYPFVTSSECMPYAACSLGFSPKLLRNITGVAKMYDTRSGHDRYFGRAEYMNETMCKLAELGEEFGSTTGRPRACKWLNLDKILKAIEISGATEIVFNKGDILEKLGEYKLYFRDKEVELGSIDEMKEFIHTRISDSECPIDVTFDFEC
jgi:adenylosuccinate synthase